MTLRDKIAVLALSYRESARREYSDDPEAWGNRRTADVSNNFAFKLENALKECKE